MTLVKNLHDLAALISQAETPETGTQFNSRLKAALGQDEHLGTKRARLFQRKTSADYVEVWPSAWIDPMGEIHECETHEEFAATKAGPADRHYPQAFLLRRGWIRVGEYEGDCYAECWKWTTKALELTQRAFQSTPKLRGDSVTVDTGQPGSAVEIPYEEFMAMNKPTEFRRYKFAKIAFCLRAWVTPEGDVKEFPAGWGHAGFAKRELGDDLYDTEAVQTLEDRRWVRVGLWEHEVYISSSRISDKQLHAIQAFFAENHQWRQPTISVHSSGDYVKLSPEEFMTLDHMTDIRRLKVAAQGEHGPDLGENGEATDPTGQFWGSAGAGLLFKAQDTGRVLFALRSAEVNEPGTWGVWGGAIDFHEDPLQAAKREAREEAGYTGEIQFEKLFTFRRDGFTYTTFLGTIPHEFKPRLNWESEGYRWVEPGEWPQPLHFGVKALLPQLDQAVEPQGVEHLESARKKTAAEAQETMALYYDVVAQVVREGADTFEKFIASLRQKLGPDFAEFLKDAAGNVGLRHLWTSVVEHDADDLENSLEHMRISPRKPTAVKSTEDPHGDERLQPGLDAMSRDEQALAHNVAVMETYPGFSHLQGGPREKAEQIVEILKDNLIWLYNEWDAGLRDRSKLWYVGGNRLIHRWAKRFQMQPHQIAAVIAALSPQQDWFTNVTLAERLLSAIKEHADTPWDDAMTQATLRLDSKGEPGWGSKVMKALGMSPEEAGKLMVGKTLREIMGTDNESLYKQAIWIRAWDEGHNPNGHRTLSPEGEFGDWDRKVNGDPIKNRWNSFGEITKAIKLAEAPDARLISDVVGENHKVRSFYNNLVAPMSKGGDVTIDTHAVAAALLRPLSAAHREVNHNFGMGLKGDIAPTSSKITGSTGLYGFYAEAYRRAGAAVGVQPREMQSITWEAVRGLFKPHQKRMDAITQGTDQAWHDVSGGKHGPDAARQRILELVGGLDRPSWSKPHPGDPAGERDSSYTGELPSPGASGRGRALPGGAGAGGARGVAAGVVATVRVSAANIYARLDRLASLLSIQRVS